MAAGRGMQEMGERWDGGAAWGVGGGRELVGRVAAGSGCRKWKYFGARELLGELLEGRSWKRGWQQEENVGGGSRLGRGSSLASSWKAAAGREGGSRKGM